jgi:hypothetical protein
MKAPVPLRLPERAQPVMFVVIDTEEEFDWGAPLSRASTSVKHLRFLSRIQSLFDRYGVRPTYVIDFPVASQADGYEPLRELVASNRCRVGAHLHPWVTPPHVETVSGRNSFTCNLDQTLQRDKLQTLTDAIVEHLGVVPRVYKAGRYGIGDSTLPVLEDLGFDVDQSVMPHYSFTDEGGPSFLQMTSEPFFFGERRRMLELPCTCAFVGAAGPAAPLVHSLVSSPSLRWARLGGIAARLRIAERLVLSPEGFTLAEMCRLTASLLRRGVRTLTMTFHSPSIEVGHTPYVRSDRDLDEFLGRIDGFLSYFFGSLSGTTTTAEEFAQGSTT